MSESKIERMKRRIFGPFFFLKLIFVIVCTLTKIFYIGKKVQKNFLMVPKIDEAEGQEKKYQNHCR